MLDTLVSAWKAQDIRAKILFTLGIFLVFRFGAHVPVPGVDAEAFRAMLGTGNLFGFIDVISGGALGNVAVFAMGIMPYINASIIMQLLTVVVPYLERCAKEGEEGRKKIIQFTRYGTVFLAFVQAVGMSIFFGRSGILDTPGIGSYIVVIVSLTAGTAFLMWLGELITERGIGNGISLIIFAGIVSGIPGGITTFYTLFMGGELNALTIAVFLIMGLIIIVGIVNIHEGQRRIPVQYAKRVVGRKVYGGQSTHIPLKVNQAGVIPVIFAMSILLFPTTIAQWFPDNTFAVWITNIFNFTSIPYMIMYAIMIIFFAYFYTAVTFNPQDVADNMKKYGGFIPGLRPGKPTSEYIDRVLSRITLAGALFLAFIALLPNMTAGVTGLNIAFGGTGMIIVVGVALETMKQLESQLMMRHYQGFMK